jgi:hypothetical protein
MIVQLTADGSSTAPLDTVISQVNEIPTPGNVTNIATLDLSPMVNAINTLQFHNYRGSLTTPPCTEGLQFLLGSQALPMQVGMYNALKAVVGANARHVQGALGTENVLVTGAGNIGAAQQQQALNQPVNQAGNQAGNQPNNQVGNKEGSQPGKQAPAPQAAPAPPPAMPHQVARRALKYFFA